MHLAVSIQNGPLTSPEMYTHIYIYICIHIHMYISIFLYIYTYVFIHIRTRNRQQQCLRVAPRRGRGSVVEFSLSPKSTVPLK